MRPFSEVGGRRRRHAHPGRETARPGDASLKADQAGSQNYAASTASAMTETAPTGSLAGWQLAQLTPQQ
jgi:hypothetical protein